MVHARINEEIELELVSPFGAEATYALVEENRDYLSEYLTWVDETTGADVVLRNIRNALVSFANRKSADWVIKEKGSIIGRIGIRESDDEAKVYELGYWISREKSHREKHNHG